MLLSTSIIIVTVVINISATISNNYNFHLSVPSPYLIFFFFWLHSNMLSTSIRFSSFPPFLSLLACNTHVSLAFIQPSATRNHIFSHTVIFSSLTLSAFDFLSFIDSCDFYKPYGSIRSID